MPEPSAESTRRRRLIALAVICLLGFGGGALTNAGVAQLLALPDNAELPDYADAEAPAVGGATVRMDMGDEGAPSPLGRSRRSLTEKQYADIIVRRNIFDSTAVYEPKDAVAVAPGDECRSDANVRLLATVVADLPTFSSALIAIGGARDSKIDGYAVGEEVGGEGRITLIEQKRVCLEGTGCICMGTDGTKVTASAEDKGDAGAEGVSKLADNKFQVDSSVIEDAMGNFEQLATQVRVSPHKGSDGQIDGYRLSAIRRGSLFEKLGIKNGDIVHGVNGNPLTSTEAAMQVYQTLKNDRSFSFDITRRNQRQSMEYEVR